MGINIHLITLSGILLAAIFVLSSLLVFKMRQVKELYATVSNLKKSLDEMDEQAKLIVRTDIELNKTQEELDKKVAGLYALQKLSRAISASLEENQIFKMVEATKMEDLGFERACVFSWNEKEKKFFLRLNIGYPKEEIGIILSSIELNKEFYLNLILQKKTISSISLQDTFLKEKIPQVFRVISFVVSPILPKEGQKGIFFVGTENMDMYLSEGDEELITILANEIGQALDNAMLYEKTWQAQQQLEKKVEERTQELKNALEELNIISKRKTDFISAVSHELRTPLTSIKGYASILIAGKLGQLPEEARLRLEKINKHSDELTGLVNDLLDISRIESGRVTMKQEPQDLNIVLSGITDMFAVQAKERNVQISYRLEEGANMVLADLGQIKRVFINLLGNAVKFLPAKNAKIMISTKKIDEKFVQVDIADNGCGIPADAKEKIFEEFYRVDNPINEQVKGTGLGLALVKHIIEAHGGKIWVKSKINEGSTFSFTLPLAQA